MKLCVTMSVQSETATRGVRGAAPSVPLGSYHKKRCAAFSCVLGDRFRKSATTCVRERDGLGAAVAEDDFRRTAHPPRLHRSESRARHFESVRIDSDFAGWNRRTDGIDARHPTQKSRMISAYEAVVQKSLPRHMPASLSGVKSVKKIRTYWVIGDSA